MSRLHRLHGFASALLRDDRGQDLIEYGLLAALIAVVCAAMVTQVGTAILNTFWAAIAAGIPKV
jgi:Flp pilus assembly pilin Flp